MNHFNKKMKVLRVSVMSCFFVAIQLLNSSYPTQPQSVIAQYFLQSLAYFIIGEKNLTS